MSSRSEAAIRPNKISRAGDRLALDGGKPIRSKPLPPASGVSLIGEEEIKAVTEVLRSRSLFRYYGPRLLGKVGAFERALSTEFQLPHALAVSSGTAALRVALGALGVGPGMEVIVPACSFLACAGAVIGTGAVPVFVESDRTLTVEPAAIETAVTAATRAILAVHVKGQLARMPDLRRLADTLGVHLIEDGAQSFGATYEKRRSGSWGDALTLSFQLAKTISAGEGGAFLCRDFKLYARAAMLHDQGWFRQEGRKEVPDAIVGENLRMTEIAGAILVEQLSKVPKMVANMQRQKRLLRSEVAKIKGLELREPTDPEGDEGSSLCLFLPDATTARLFRKALNAENIETEDLYKYLAYAHAPILRQSLAASPGCSFECPRAHRKVEYRLGLCPRTEKLLSRAVNIPISPALKDRDREDILAGVQRVWRHLSR